MARKANTLTKTCTKTGQVFTGTFEELTESFYRDKSQKDGLSPWSKAAEKAYNKAYFASLKKVDAARVRDIEDDAAKATFEKGMKAERVKRGKAAKTTTPKATKARTTVARRTSRSTKKA